MAWVRGIWLMLVMLMLYFSSALEKERLSPLLSLFSVSSADARRIVVTLGGVVQSKQCSSAVQCTHQP